MGNSKGMKKLKNYSFCGRIFGIHVNLTINTPIF